MKKYIYILLLAFVNNSHAQESVSAKSPTEKPVVDKVAPEKPMAEKPLSVSPVNDKAPSIEKKEQPSVYIPSPPKTSETVESALKQKKEQEEALQYRAKYGRFPTKKTSLPERKPKTMQEILSDKSVSSMEFAIFKMNEEIKNIKFKKSPIETYITGDGISSLDINVIVDFVVGNDTQKIDYTVCDDAVKDVKNFLWVDGGNIPFMYMDGASKLSLSFSGSLSKEEAVKIGKEIDKKAKITVISKDGIAVCESRFNDDKVSHLKYRLVPYFE